MGIGGSDIKNAVALKNQHNANILILDSFWSRGREVNGGRYDGRLGRRLTFDDRILDLSAAGKFLASQGVDASKTFIIGGSQGGGTVMRAFTQDPEIEKLIKPYYRGGISLYPACSDMSPTMQLGPYFAKVIIISGGRDYGNPISECPTVSVKSAARWLHWPEATHGFDLDTHGVWKPSVDGDCSKKNFAKNQYIEMCYSEKRTQEMYQEVQRFVQ
jgi:dienelactone hydrolase